MPTRYDASGDDWDDALPPSEPKRTRPPWLLLGLLAGGLMLGGLLAVGVFATRRQAMEARRAEDVAVMRQRDAEEEAARARAVVRVDREPVIIAVAPRKGDAPPGAVSVRELAEQFMTHERQANEAYKGRRIRCTAVVHAVAKLEDGSSVLTFADAEWQKSAVRAFFPAAESEKLAKLEHGVQIHFDGRCDGWDRSVVPAVVAVRDCRLVPGPVGKGPH